MKKYSTFEVCPFCEEEVELNAELMVQTCPHCGRRIVTCSMCRACDTEDNYCTHCCLDYQARVENEEANWQYKGYKIVLEDEEMIDDNGNSIGMGYRACVECPDGDVKTSGLVFAQEKDARIEAEDMIDEMTEDESDEPEVQPQAEDKPELAEEPKEYKVPFLRHQWCDVVVKATSPEEAVRKARAIFTEGHDGFVDWEDIDTPELDKYQWETRNNLK